MVVPNVGTLVCMLNRVVFTVPGTVCSDPNDGRLLVETLRDETDTAMKLTDGLDCSD